MLLKLDTFENRSEMLWKFWNVVLGGGWRRSVGLIVWRTKKCYMEASLQTVKRRKATWIGHIWRTNCLLKHVIEGQIEGRENEERKQTATGWPWGKERILEIGRGNTRSHCLENSLWKRQSTCHKTDYRNNEDTLMSQFRRACALFESFSRDGHIVNRLGYLSSQINGAFFFFMILCEFLLILSSKCTPDV